MLSNKAKWGKVDFKIAIKKSFDTLKDFLLFVK